MAAFCRFLSLAAQHLQIVSFPLWQDALLDFFGPIMLIMGVQLKKHSMQLVANLCRGCAVHLTHLATTEPDNFAKNIRVELSSGETFQLCPAKIYKVLTFPVEARLIQHAADIFFH